MLTEYEFYRLALNLGWILLGFVTGILFEKYNRKKFGKESNKEKEVDK